VNLLSQNFASPCVVGLAVDYGAARIQVGIDVAWAGADEIVRRLDEKVYPGVVR
jgi:hypothetical protein